MDTNTQILEPTPVKALTIEELRDRLRPNEAIDAINEVQATVQDEWHNLSKNQIDALKLLADIGFRKLAKYLPDLKAMDHNLGETASKVNFVIHLDSVSEDKTSPTRLNDPNTVKL